VGILRPVWSATSRKVSPSLSLFFRTSIPKLRTFVGIDLPAL
jgi:hypothetical protein